jgi:hypothetical protein
MGYDDPNMVIPEAKNAAERLGLGSEVSQFGSGGGYGQGQPSQGGGTVKMQAPNGQTKDIPADQVEHYKSLGAKVVGQ